MTDGNPIKQKSIRDAPYCWLTMRNIVAALGRPLKRDGYNVLKAYDDREGLELQVQNEGNEAQNMTAAQ